MAHLLLFSDMM